MLKVLHIEDSPDDAALVCALLESGGYELDYRRVEKSEEMEAALVREEWDLILSDYNLPAFDGARALERLKESGKDIPFIIVSSCIGEETAVDLMKAGAQDYVMKDRLARLLPAINRELQESEIRRQKSRADEELIAKDKLLRDTVITLGEGLLVLKKDGQLMFMNVEAERLLGWTEVELSTQNLHKTLHALKPDGSSYPELNCFDKMEACRIDLDYFVKKDGSTFPVSYVTTPVIEDGVVVAAVIVFQDITLRKQAEHDLIESRHQLQKLSVFLQTAREEERKRIARELHDELGQALTALRFDLNWVKDKYAIAPHVIDEKLSAMVVLVDKTVDSMRRISEDLRPGMLDDLGLAAAIEHHVERFTGRTGIACELSMSHDDFELESDVSTAIFRLLQESLTNVARHSKASKVMIRLHDLGSEILLIVQDNGDGLPAYTPERRKTYGLLGMGERVKLLGGHWEISSEPGKGTRIEAGIPRQLEAAEK